MKKFKLRKVINTEKYRKWYNTAVTEIKQIPFASDLLF